MSYGAELSEEIYIANAMRYAENERDIAEGIWTMRDGNKINIKDMSREHLRNAISVLKNGNSTFMEVKFKSEKQLQKLEYIEPTSDLENLMKDWENIEKYFPYIIPKKDTNESNESEE